MEPPSIIYTGLIIISLMAVALLSMAESSIIAANKYKLRGLIEKGDKRARAVMRLLDEHEKFFSAVILSGNLFTILATSLGTALVIDMFGGEHAIIISTAAMTFLTVVFGELTPKSLALKHADRLSLIFAKPLEMYIRLISPVVWFFSGIVRFFGGGKDRKVSPFLTAEEIKTMISIGEEEGAIEEDEREMLHRIFEFGDKEVSEVMVPRTEIVSIPKSATVGDAIDLVSKKGYSRYPVVKDNIDNITGILYLKDILINMSNGSVDNDTPIEGMMREPYFVPENKMATELLDEMQKEKFHIAIVIDEYGGTDGLITLEDIIEEIVGSLQDEFEAIEAEKEIEVVDESTFIITAHTDLDEVNELVGIDIQSKEFNTIGGFVFGLFGRLPRVGEQVRYQNLRFLIFEMDERKVGKIKITKL